VRDPDFPREATKLELEVAPVQGVEIEQLMKEIYAASPDIVQLARDAMKD
jgi:hypothetical protein